MKELLEKINNREAKVGVIGLGYVGLPLTIEFLKAGFNVCGYDLDGEKVSSLNEKKFSMDGVQMDVVQRSIDQKQFRASSNIEDLKDLDAISICVPTPLSKTRDPDLSYIMSSVNDLAQTLTPPALIVLESTTYPGTTEEIVIPIMDEMDWNLDEHYYLAFSPERVDPGNTEYGTRNIPKVIGGQTDDSLKLAMAFYKSIIEHIHPVTSTRVAEMTKLLENTFRMVNVALVNEIAQMWNHMKINVWEVIDAAATKPFGFMPFYPGPGLGGHCLPVDPIYLSWKARMMDIEARFIDLAQMVNTNMPRHVVEIISDALNRGEKALLKSKVLVLGITYKKDVADIREAPSIDIIRLLIRKGAEVSYHDPYVKNVEIEGVDIDELFVLDSVELDNKTLSMQDAVVVVTDHSEYDMESILENVSLMIDTRNATKSVQKNREKIVLL